MAIAAGANAFPTALVSIPVADILKHREVVLGHTLKGFDNKFDGRYSNFTSVTIGLFDRVEVGASTDYLGNNAWSAKALVYESDMGGFSVGLMNAADKRVDPYAVGRLDFGKLRVHGGIGRFDNLRTGMIGVDYGFSDSIILQADHTGGSGGYTWFAASVLLGEGFSVQGAYGRPNNSANPDSHFVYVGYGFRF